MSTDIYFFSGTGNSLHVARELRSRLPDARLVRIVGLLDQELVKADADSVGLVFPVHALTIPLAVKRFVRQIDLGPDEYVFAAATRMGTVFNGFGSLERMLRRKGRRLDAGFLPNMPSNDIKDIHYRSPPDADIRRLETGVQDKLEDIAAVVQSRQRRCEKDSSYLIDVNHWQGKLVVFLLNLSEHSGGVNYFSCDPGGTGCGI